MKDYCFVIRYTAGDSSVKTKIVEAATQCPTEAINALKAYYGEKAPVNVLSVKLEQF